MPQTIIPQTRASLRDALFVIFSKKHVFKWIFIIIFVLVNAAAWFSDPVFKVSASVLVLPTVEASLQADAPRGSLQSNPVTPQMINSEVNIMLSDELLREVVKKLELTAWEPQNVWLRIVWNLQKSLKTVLAAIGLSHPADPLDLIVIELRKRLDIKPVTMSNMIEVSLKGKNPEEITNIVNTLVDLYISRHIEVYQFKGGISFFGEQTDLYKKNLEEAEKALKDFQMKWCIISIDEQRVGNLDVLAKLREQVSTAEGRITELKTRLDLSQKDIQAMTKANTENPTLIEMSKSILPLIVERERIRALYPIKSPEYRDINNQVLRLHWRFKKELGRIMAGGMIDLQAAIAQKAALEMAIMEIEEESIFLTEKEVELNRLKRELAKAEKSYLLYSDKTEEARIERQKDKLRVSNVTVADKAHTPSVPIFPQKGLMGLLSIIMGAIMGSAGAFLAYYLDHTVKQPHDLPRNAQTPVLSAVALVDNPSKKDSNLKPGYQKPTRGEGKADDDGRSPVWDKMVESAPNGEETGMKETGAQTDLWMTDPKKYPGLTDNLRLVKNKLKALNQEQQDKVFLFTGADNNVGTSTLVINLGLILARDLSDRRILLIDACLSRPSLHDVLGQPIAPGVLDNLSKDDDLSRITRNCLLPNLDVITIGEDSSQISSPYDLQRFGKLLEEAAAEYDFVLLDSDPALKSSHSRILTTKVDGVILVAESHMTRWEVLVELRRQLENDKARLVGGILNKRRFPIPKWVYRFI